MEQYELTKEQWERIKPLLPPEATGKRGRPRKDNRTMLNGMLRIVRSGAQRRELPEAHGPWQSAYARFAKCRDDISEHGASYVIPPQSNVSDPWPVDWHLHTERHLVGCFFQKIEWFCRIATRYDKLDASFLAFVDLASIAVLLIEHNSLDFSNSP